MTTRKPKIESSSLSATRGIQRVLLWFGTIIAHCWVFLTTPPGSAILYGLLALYFSAVSAECYWMAIPGKHHAFLPKPFIQDRASLEYFQYASHSPDFWMAIFFCGCVLAIEAKVFRDLPLPIAKAMFWEVAHEQVPQDVDDDTYLKLRRHRLKVLKNVGMKRIRMMSILIAVVFSVDAVIGWHSFPLWGVAFGQWFVNVTWFALQLFGAESAIAMFIDTLNPVEHGPKVEVLQ